MTSSPPCRWTKTKDLSFASFVRPPEVVHFSIVIGVSRGWLKTSYSLFQLMSEHFQWVVFTFRHRSHVGGRQQKISR